MKRQTEFIGIVSIIIALIVLFFGDNLYEQINGHSFFDKAPPITNQPTANPVIQEPTPTISASNFSTPISTIFINSPTITPEPLITIKAEDITPYIKGEPEGIKNVIFWWQEVEPSNVDGIITPASLPSHQCFGLAWNTKEYGYRVLVVFQSPVALTFRDGGWRTTVCIPNNVIISPEDVGKIQADWLGKRYVDVGAPSWSVQVIAPATSLPENETLSNCASLQSGETRTILAGTYILGDIIIDGIPQYVSSIPNEGTVAYFEKEATVLAQWGAACFTGSSKLKDEVIQGELQHGCGSKCTSVRFVLVQNDGQHVEIFP